MSKKTEKKVENEVVTKNEEVKEEKVTKEVVKAETEKVEADKNAKSIIANTTFIDRYTNAVYEKGTEFIIADVEETKKISDKKYKISKARAEQIKNKGYAD